MPTTPLSPCVSSIDPCLPSLKDLSDRGNTHTPSTHTQHTFEGGEKIYTHKRSTSRVFGVGVSRVCSTGGGESSRVESTLFWWLIWHRFEEALEALRSTVEHTSQIEGHIQSEFVDEQRAYTIGESTRIDPSTGTNPNSLRLATHPNEHNTPYHSFTLHTPSLSSSCHTLSPLSRTRLIVLSSLSASSSLSVESSFSPLPPLVCPPSFRSAVRNSMIVVVNSKQ